MSRQPKIVHNVTVSGEPDMARWKAVTAQWAKELRPDPGTPWLPPASTEVPSRWIGVDSRDYLYNADLLRAWVRRLPIPFRNDTRSIEVDENGAVLRIEVWRWPVADNQDRPATKIYDVRRYGWRWPAPLLVEASA